MPEPRISVLIVAKNEAHNLRECLDAVSWADERVVVVDPASRDATRGDRSVDGGRGDRSCVRRLCQSAQLRRLRLLPAIGCFRSTQTSG